MKAHRSQSSIAFFLLSFSEDATLMPATILGQKAQQGLKASSASVAE
jgi:hypothetical protein